MTEGFFPLDTFSAIFSPAQAGSPTAAAAAVQTLTKSRREKGEASATTGCGMVFLLEAGEGIGRLSVRQFGAFRGPTWR